MRNEAHKVLHSSICMPLHEGHTTTNLEIISGLTTDTFLGAQTVKKFHRHQPSTSGPAGVFNK